MYLEIAIHKIQNSGWTLFPDFSSQIFQISRVCGHPGTLWLYVVGRRETKRKKNENKRRAKFEAYNRNGRNVF